MAKEFPKTLTKYGPEHWKALDFFFWCAEYRREATGIEHGWVKGNHAFWFCDNGTIEYYEVSLIVEDSW